MKHIPPCSRRSRLAPLLALAAVTAGLVAASPAAAQTRVRWDDSGGWSANADHVQAFDPATAVLMHGAVERLETYRPRRGVDPGVRMLLRVGNLIHTVHLGPAWYVTRQDARFTVGDEVEVAGSEVRWDGATVILASSVDTGNQVLRLRDAAGRPRWVGLERAAAGDAEASVPRWSLELPEGDIARGRKAFTDLWCHACHVVRGHEKDFPAPYAQPPVPVVLGLERKRPSRPELANSIVNPSHRLEPGFQKELVSAGKYSRMGDYNESMTLQQLSDLVAFLETVQRP